MNYEYCDGMTYTVKKGDTLYEISRKHNVPLALLLRANPYVDVFNLQIGDTICIPTNPQMRPDGNEMAPMPQQMTPAREPESQRPMQPGMGMPSMPRQTTPPREPRNSQPMSPIPPLMSPPAPVIQPGRRNGFCMDCDDGDDLEDMEEHRENLREEMKDEFSGGMDELRQDIDEDMARGNITSRRWEKYVVQPGDTLADVLQNMSGDVEEFLERNRPDNIYMLPGVAYYVQTEND